jgi:AcrR family transcriptional regulator
MKSPSRASNPDAREARADRILDGAADLLLRHGYRRVTVDDVARSAGIGKGTIYLHWKTREALFRAVLLREADGVLQDMLAGLRRDAEFALPWRLMPALFLAVVGRPILRALFVADSEVLGGLVRDDAARKAQQGLASNDGYLQVLLDYQVIRADLARGEAGYLLSTTVRGFFLAERSSEQRKPGLERRAELLGDTIQRALAGAGSLSQEHVAALAERVVELFTTVLVANRAELRRAHE